MRRAKERPRIQPRTSILLIALVICTGASPGRATPGRLVADPRADAIVEALHSGAHADAERLVDAWLGAVPAEPVALLLRIKTAWWQVLEGRDTDGRLEARLDADLESLRAIVEPRLRRDPEDAVALYALGEAYCASARLAGLRGRAWATLRQHQKGTVLLRELVRLQPEAPEPLASLGVFHYYAARLPGFLRFLARLARVQGDRERGLAELRRAAAAPGLQQAEATFFLLEVLAHVEDEQLEALPLAQLQQARYPRSLAFHMKLGDVLYGLERPDLAVRLYDRAAATEMDGCARTQYRFFAIRTLCDTGRAAAALERLEQLAPDDVRAVAWMAGWTELYRGLCLAQLGRGPEARAAFERARGAPDVAGSRAAAQQELSRRDGAVWAAARTAWGLLLWDGDAGAAHRLVEAASPQAGSATAETRALLDLAGGVAALRLLDHGAAAERFATALHRERPDAAWLVVRLRQRLLQALAWSGRVDEARAEAARLHRLAGEWGSNRQLQALVQSCLEPRARAPRFELAAAAGAPARLRLADSGFTQVELEIEGDPDRLPLRCAGSTWEIVVPRRPQQRRYAFVVEGQSRLTDPECEGIELEGGRAWSVWDEPPSP